MEKAIRNVASSHRVIRAAQFYSGEASLSLGSFCISVCCLANMVFMALLSFSLISVSIELASTAHGLIYIIFLSGLKNFSQERTSRLIPFVFCCLKIGVNEWSRVKAGRKGRVGKKCFSIFSFSSERFRLDGKLREENQQLASCKILWAALGILS